MIKSPFNIAYANKYLFAVWKLEDIRSDNLKKGKSRGKPKFSISDDLIDKKYYESCEPL